jgi:alpha-galactosidase
MQPKICIIGAGSAVFSLSLIRDLCLTPNLRGSTISLMDIDQERVEAVYTLCKRYAIEVGIALHLEKTTDRHAALEGADFVINTALVAGHSRLRDGWKVGQQHGYRFGGSLHLMHDEAFWINFYQLQFFESVLNDILAICPDAWYLQVANPVLAGITYLARKYPQAKIIGLCHGFSGVYRLADVLGLEREHFTFEVPGVNHSVWLTHAYQRGENIFPLLDAWIEREAPAYWKTCPLSDELGPKAIDLYRRFGAFPIGDTCTVGGGSWPWWYHTDAETEQRWHEDPAAWWQRYFVSGERKVAEIARVAGDDGASVVEHFPPRMSGEVMVPIIESIACDIPRVIIGNIQNSGEFVPGLPRDFAVEIPTLVSKRGIEGIRTQGLPAPILSHILHDRVATVNLELEAYASGSREALLQLIQMDPWTHSEQQARDMLLFTLILTGLGSLYTAFTGDLTNFVIARFITGIGIGADLAIVNTYINEVAPLGSRARYTAFIFTNSAIGAMLGIWLGLLLTTEATPFPLGLPFALASASFSSGWRIMYGVGAALALIGILLRFQLPESPRWLVLRGRIDEADKIVTQMETRAQRIQPLEPVQDISEAPAKEEVSEVGYKGILTNNLYLRRILILLPVWIFGYVTIYTISAGFTSVLATLGYPPPEAGLITAIGGWGFLLCAFFAAAFGERLERKWWLPIGAVITLVGCVMVALGGRFSDPHAIPLVAFVGSLILFFGFNVWVPMTYTWSAESFPTRARTTGFGVVDGVGHIGGGFGMLVVAPLLPSLSPLAALLLIGGFLVIASLIAQFGIATRGKRLDHVSP